MTKPSQYQNRHSSPESRSLKSRQFRGIGMRKWGKWASQIRMPNCGSRIWLGSYDTPEKAARAYDFAEYYLRGTKAKLNYPDCPPKIPNNLVLSPSQIQLAAAKFATEEVRPPSEDGAASSLFRLEVECGMDGQQIAAEQGPAIQHRLAVSLNPEDAPPLVVSMESMEDWLDSIANASWGEILKSFSR